MSKYWLIVTVFLSLVFFGSFIFFASEQTKDENRLDEQDKEKLANQWDECQAQLDPVNKSSCYQHYDISWKEQTDKALYIETHFFPNTSWLYFHTILSLIVCVVFLVASAGILKDILVKDTEDNL